MKKTTFFCLIALLAVGMTACKYEDGPLVSIHSKEARVVNTWVPEAAEINGEDGIISDGNGGKCVGFDFYVGVQMALEKVTFLETGGCLILYGMGQNMLFQGVWSFQEEREVIHLQCSPPYPFNLDPSNSVSMDWQILLLKKNHLRVTYAWEENLYLVDFVAKQ